MAATAAAAVVAAHVVAALRDALNADSPLADIDGSWVAVVAGIEVVGSVDAASDTVTIVVGARIVVVAICVLDDTIARIATQGAGRTLLFERSMNALVHAGDFAVWDALLKGAAVPIVGTFAGRRDAARQVIVLRVHAARFRIARIRSARIQVVAHSDGEEVLVLAQVYFAGHKGIEVLTVVHRALVRVIAHSVGFVRGVPLALSGRRAFAATAAASVITAFLAFAVGDASDAGRKLICAGVLSNAQADFVIFGAIEVTSERKAIRVHFPRVVRFVRAGIEALRSAGVVLAASKTCVEFGTALLARVAGAGFVPTGVKGSIFAGLVIFTAIPIAILLKTERQVRITHLHAEHAATGLALRRPQVIT